jgi:uncharacterized protein
MFHDNKIRDMSQKEYNYDEFIKEINNMDKIGAEFYIGTDSQVIKKQISIVTCVCAISRNLNKVFYVKEKIDKAQLSKMRLPEYIVEQTKNSSALRMRMLLEAYRSVEAAMELEQFINNKLHIHLDIGADSRKNKSSIARKELEYLVQAQGYECSIKPDAWAASSVADKVAKS